MAGTPRSLKMTDKAPSKTAPGQDIFPTGANAKNPWISASKIGAKAQFTAKRVLCTVCTVQYTVNY